ncbi:MAG: IPT/TIG domain-containing protein, partial [Candidatus Binataceae bacterium]|nr:IPT/TIG domain-containing protein [Candidatus Binataceae bacterium]
MLRQPFNDQRKASDSTIELSCRAGAGWLRDTLGRLLLALAFSAAAIAVCSGVASAGNVGYVYDSLGRLVAVYDASGNAAAYKYDAVGNLLSITNYSSSQFAGFDLSSGSGAPDSTLTIYGTDFCASPTVTINGTNAAVDSSTSTQIVITVPGNATSGQVVVTCGSNQINVGTFTVGLNAPAVAGFTPGTGGAGTSVTITGTNFATNSSDDKVVFNDSEAAVTAASATSLTATVPPNATSGPITVATVYGQAASSADFIVPPPGPALGYTGQASIGTPVTVSLGNANQQGLLLFNAIAGQQVSVALSSSTFSTCPTVTLYNPNGGVIASQSYCSAGGFIDTQTLPATGTYSLTVNPGNSAGSVAVTIYNAPTQLGNISIGGSPVTVAASVPGQDTELTFSGSSGQ